MSNLGERALSKAEINERAMEIASIISMSDLNELCIRNLGSGFGMIGVQDAIKILPTDAVNSLIREAVGG